VPFLNGWLRCIAVDVRFIYGPDSFLSVMSRCCLSWFVEWRILFIILNLLKSTPPNHIQVFDSFVFFESKADRLVSLLRIIQGILIILHCLNTKRL
jgi:hypothetical protein